MLFLLAFALQGEGVAITVTAKAVSAEETKPQKDDEAEEEIEEDTEEDDDSCEEEKSLDKEQPKVQEAASLNMALISSQKEKLQELLKEYEASLSEKESAHSSPQWTCLNHSLRLQDQDPVLVTVKKQLNLTMGKDADEKVSSKFDEDLEVAVKKFQKINFLEADGVIGKKTCIALNLTPKERAEKIRQNIKRWEALESSLKGKYVLVNIPTYSLYALEDQKIELTEPVIVGRKDRRTPLFTSFMNSVVLNPAWGVPVTIFIKDKLQKVLEDPEYLSKSGFTVTDQDGQVVTDSAVDWMHVSLHHFPYTVRQSPGKNNALGAIKFNLDNKDAIYLHGTPQKNLFNKISRPFSSGCVRLQSPQDLAIWALKGTKYNNLQKLQQKIRTSETSAILLKEPIPVHFVYITVWVDKDGTPLFSDDPYSLDSKT